MTLELEGKGLSIVLTILTTKEASCFSQRKKADRLAVSSEE